MENEAFVEDVITYINENEVPKITTLTCVQGTDIISNGDVHYPSITYPMETPADHHHMDCLQKHHLNEDIDIQDLALN